jgi:hypothetical protein
MDSITKGIQSDVSGGLAALFVLVAVVAVLAIPPWMLIRSFVSSFVTRPHIST